MSGETIVSLASLFVACLSIADHILDSKHRYKIENDKLKEKAANDKIRQLHKKEKEFKDYIGFTSIVIDSKGAKGTTTQSYSYGLMLLYLPTEKTTNIQALQRAIKTEDWEMAEQDFDLVSEQILKTINDLKVNDNNKTDNSN